jgi:predicted MFS family arabinose efflux permease
VILAAGGVGAIVGSVVARRLVGRLGSPRTLIAAQLLTGVARLFVPLAFGPSLAIAAWLAASEFLLGASRSVFNITQISVRQTIIPTSRWAE